MRRVLSIAVVAGALVAAVFVACGDDSAHAPADASVDAPPDNGSGSGSGSGSALMAVLEPSPPDHGLEIIVGLSSMAIVIGPRTARRRRDVARAA